MPTHTAEITIQASAQKVFDALTQPELVQLWQYGRVVTTDWTVGGPIRFRSDVPGAAKPFEEWGTILAVRLNELVKYSLFTPRAGLEDRPENYAVTSYEISQEDGHSRIAIVQEDNRPYGFAPPTLKPILAALKSVAEEAE